MITEVGVYLSLDKDQLTCFVKFSPIFPFEKNAMCVKLKAHIHTDTYKTFFHDSYKLKTDNYKYMHTSARSPRFIHYADVHTNV